MLTLENMKKSQCYRKTSRGFRKCKRSFKKAYKGPDNYIDSDPEQTKKDEEESEAEK